MSPSVTQCPASLADSLCPGVKRCRQMLDKATQCGRKMRFTTPLRRTARNPELVSKVVAGRPPCARYVSKREQAMSQTAMPGAQPDELLLDYAGAAQKLNVSVRYLQVRVQRRSVPHRRLGTRVRFPSRTSPRSWR